MTRITCILYEEVCTVFDKSRTVVLRMRNVSVKVVGKIITHVLCSVILFFENHAQMR
jgi:predicted nuclease of predicted toxin-antitoxin system